ncbi:MAG TPA: crossover junction endodeoxyribonuclease RuvC [Actinomycetota bacterium]
MFERVVLGVDPGVASTGLAAVGGGRRRAEVIWATTVRTPAGAPEAQRLRSIASAVRDAIATHRPEALAIERLLWGRNTGSAMGVARASGAVMVAGAEAGIPVHEYAPLEVKMAITGDGNAGKQQVRRSLARIHRVEGVPRQPDAADAAAVALCHLHRAPLAEAVR